jgi:hypothetical protein
MERRKPETENIVSSHVCATNVPESHRENCILTTFYSIKVTRRTVPCNNSSRCLFYILYFFLLHVSALAGRLQAEYTIILGSYLNHNGSVVLCY